MVCSFERVYRPFVIMRMLQTFRELLWNIVYLCCPTLAEERPALTCSRRTEIAFLVVGRFRFRQETPG
jgi:hypothetical protein